MTVQIIGGVDTHAAVHCAAAIDTHGPPGRCRRVPRHRGRLPPPPPVAGVPRRSPGRRRRGDRRVRCWSRPSPAGPPGACGGGAAARPASSPQSRQVRPDRRRGRSPGRAGRHRDHDPQAGRWARGGDPSTAHRPPGCPQGQDRGDQHAAAIIITAPDPLRAQLPSGGLPNKIIDACSRLRPDLDRLDDPTQATKTALCSIALRARTLRDEIKALDCQIQRLHRHRTHHPRRVRHGTRHHRRPAGQPAAWS